MLQLQQIKVLKVKAIEKKTQNLKPNKNFNKTHFVIFIGERPITHPH